MKTIIDWLVTRWHRNHRLYSQFHETLTTNVPNFVAKFASWFAGSPFRVLLKLCIRITYEIYSSVLKPAICGLCADYKRTHRIHNIFFYPEVKEANQICSLQAGLWISSWTSQWTCELRNKVRNITFVVKVSWNHLSQKQFFCFSVSRKWQNFY
jgi:hypothetical protein